MNTLKLTEAAKIKAARTYNSASEYFDDPPLAFWERYGRRTVERLNLRAGASVLDVGCGTGASALPAAAIVGPSGTVLGVDLASRMLERAKAKADQRGLRNLEFRLADMTALGIPNGHFDAVVSVFSIFFVPDMEALTRDLWRMVRPGGKLALTVWGPDFFEPVYSIWRAAVKVARPDLYSDFHPWERIASPQQLQQLLRDSGVPQAEVVPEAGQQHLESPEDWWKIVLGSGTRSTIDAMDAATASYIHDQTVGWLRNQNVATIQTNVIYAVAAKDQV